MPNVEHHHMHACPTMMCRRSIDMCKSYILCIHGMTKHRALPSRFLDAASVKEPLCLQRCPLAGTGSSSAFWPLVAWSTMPTSLSICCVVWLSTSSLAHIWLSLDLASLRTQLLSKGEKMSHTLCNSICTVCSGLQQQLQQQTSNASGHTMT